MLPDVLTNAGGVTVSYFEWVQDLGRLFWIATRSGAARREAWRRVRPRLGPRRERGFTLRNAALVAGIREVAAALDARGIYP